MIVVSLKLRLNECVLNKLDTVSKKYSKTREELIQDIITTFAEFYDE